MAQIQHITEGMAWSQAVGIINQVIDTLNALDTVVGGSLVDGKIDYSAIVNRPKINGVEIVGDLTQDDLDINAGQTVVTRLREIESSMDSFSRSLGQKVALTDLPDALSRAGFKTQTQLEEVFPLISGLASRLGNLGYKTLTELGTAGYKTVTELGSAGYKTVTELGTLGYKTLTEMDIAGYKTQSQLEEVFITTSSLPRKLDSLGYKTQTELYNLGYMTQRELSNAGYRTVTEMASLGYRTTTELDSAGYYKKPAGGIPTSDMSSNLQTVVNQAVGAAQTATNAASTAAALPNSNVITRVDELETAVGDNSSGMQKDVNDVKTEIGDVGVNESITKDLDMTRKFINAVVDIAIEYKDDDPGKFVTTLAEKTKLIVKQ